MPNTMVAVPGMHVLPRVLVIAEYRAARRALQRLLGSDGYDVAVTANMAVGLELLRDAPPVAVVLDLHRRSSSAAWDVYLKIKQVVCETPIIVLGNSLESDIFPPLSPISRSVEATLEALLRILRESSSALAAVAS